MKNILISVALLTLGAGAGVVVTLQIHEPAATVATAPAIDADALAAKIAKAHMAELDTRSAKMQAQANDYRCRMSGGKSPVCGR